ncbi:MAG: molybdenum cofactor guanylyltransferase [Gammaproteobacteria bacterium]|nr:molybdenum cofactor guanylyltransferase [Gammaproteobacteria bacterium]
MSQKTLGVILSGGAGNRFAGVDKGLQMYRGKPLIAWVVSAVLPQVDELLICINRNEDDYKKLGHRLVFDADPDYQGPIAGVLAALEYFENSPGNELFCRALISSCDSPSLPCDYLKFLIDALEQNQSSVAVVNDGKRNQNLHCLINRSAWDSLRHFYRDGGRAMHRWHRQIGAVEVDFSANADCFLNINSPNQLS